MTWQPALTPSKRIGFAASSIYTAMPEENQRLETSHVGGSKRAKMRDFLQFSHFVASKSTFSYVFLWTSKLLRQNQCFVQGLPSIFHHISQNATPARVCTLSPLDATLTTRFAKNTQHDTSKVLRLPREMTMDTSKVLRLPRKLERTVWKCFKSIAPATQNDDTLWNMLECHKVPRLPRETRLHGIGNLQKWPLLQNSP